MKTEPNEPANPSIVGKDGIYPQVGSESWQLPGLTKREYFAASACIQNEVADMIKKPDPDYLSLITGVKQPKVEFPIKNEDILSWAKYWFNIEASLKVLKADALIEALNK